MRQQAAPRRRPGRVAAGAEDDVPAHGVGERLDGARRLGRAGVGVDAHTAEVVAEAPLQRRADGRVERPSGGREHLVHDPRRHGGARPGGLAEQLVLVGARAARAALEHARAGGRERGRRNGRGADGGVHGDRSAHPADEVSFERGAERLRDRRAEGSRRRRGHGDRARVDGGNAESPCTRAARARRARARPRPRRPGGRAGRSRAGRARRCGPRPAASRPASDLALGERLLELGVLGAGRPQQVRHPHRLARVGGEEGGVERDVADVAAGDVEPRQRARRRARRSASRRGKTRRQISRALRRVRERELRRRSGGGAGTPGRARSCRFVVRMARPR